MGVQQSLPEVLTVQALASSCCDPSSESSGNLGTVLKSLRMVNKELSCTMLTHVKGLSMDLPPKQPLQELAQLLKTSRLSRLSVNLGTGRKWRGERTGTTWEHDQIVTGFTEFADLLHRQLQTVTHLKATCVWDSHDENISECSASMDILSKSIPSLHHVELTGPILITALESLGRYCPKMTCIDVGLAYEGRLLDSLSTSAPNVNKVRFHANSPLVQANYQEYREKLCEVIARIDTKNLLHINLGKNAVLCPELWMKLPHGLISLKIENSGFHWDEHQLGPDWCTETLPFLTLIEWSHFSLYDAIFVLEACPNLGLLMGDIYCTTTTEMLVEWERFTVLIQRSRCTHIGTIVLSDRKKGMMVQFLEMATPAIGVSSVEIIAISSSVAFRGQGHHLCRIFPNLKSLNMGCLVMDKWLHEFLTLTQLEIITFQYEPNITPSGIAMLASHHKRLRQVFLDFRSEQDFNIECMLRSFGVNVKITELDN